MTVLGAPRRFGLTKRNLDCGNRLKELPDEDKVKLQVKRQDTMIGEGKGEVLEG